MPLMLLILCEKMRLLSTTPSLLSPYCLCITPPLLILTPCLIFSGGRQNCAIGNMSATQNLRHRRCDSTVGFLRDARDICPHFRKNLRSTYALNVADFV